MISVTDAESALSRTKSGVMTARICEVPMADPSRLANPTATSANGNSVSRRPPNAPQAATRGSDSSLNLRRRPAIPSTAEKNTPAKKPGTASAGSGASKTSKKALHGRPGRRMLATPIDTPATAQPKAQVRPIPTAPRTRLNQFFITDSRGSRAHRADSRALYNTKYSGNSLAATAGRPDRRQARPGLPFPGGSAIREGPPPLAIVAIWRTSRPKKPTRFYGRLGYTVFAELHDFPPRHTHYHLKKSFGQAR